MAHISFSEIKIWNECSFKHKLMYKDKLKGFVGNLYTAFGSAMHSVCEKKLLKEDVDDDFFIHEFEKNLESLDDDVNINQKLIYDMMGQGKKIIPEIKDALDNYFEKDYEVLFVEMPLIVPIEGEEDYNFKGYIDAVVMTPHDKKIHIFDWKTCSWGWDARKKNDKMVTYQLTLYKHFFAQKLKIDPNEIETHFALLKRTAKYNRVEFFRVTSGPKKTQNALKLLNKALYNIKKKRHIKNRLSCHNCNFRHTKHCP